MKALALMSGGLDSGLAAKLIVDQGIDVIGLHFVLPISSMNPEENDGLRSAIEECAKIGIPLETVQFGEEYFDLLLTPKHGHGSAINPCVDCHALMLRVAKGMMEKLGASFVLTGEVLGQRPMSQLRAKLKIVENESGLDGLLVRPLSAKHLEETIPEREGWIDREKLMGIEGRKRRAQMDMAKETGLDYLSPAGGCLLTDKHFAKKFREHIKFSKLEMSDFPLLKIGRHFRLPDGAKLVVGRNEPENNKIEKLVREGDLLFVPADDKGPNGLLRGGNMDEAVVQLAGDIVASYCNGEVGAKVVFKTVGEAGGIEKEKSCELRKRAVYDEYSV